MDASQQGGPLQQLGGKGPLGGVGGVKQLQATAGMGGGHAREQFEHRIHHQLGQLGAGEIDDARLWISQPDQLKQLALLVVVGPGDLGQFPRLKRKRGHHQQIAGLPLAGVAALRVALAQPLLKIAKAEGHGGGELGWCTKP
jgi:hypothetical protein